MAGITASEKTLRHSLASEGYHRRVARVKPFLKPSHLNVSIPFLFSLSCFFYIYLYNYFVYPFSFIFFHLYFAIGSYCNMCTCSGNGTQERAVQDLLCLVDLYLVYLI